MEIKVPAGKYILAVSGGVDSIVLLDLLAGKPGIDLVVAHFDHGIRPESVKDEELVATTAKRLNLAFEAGYGRLGSKASEDTARQARYRFLEQIQDKYKANAIITAHHQDDLIETAILNILRGTGHRGLAAISSNERIVRPLLSYPKTDILAYAKANKLKWYEDASNKKEVYLRNYIRNSLLSGMTIRQRQHLISNIDKVANNSSILDAQIAKISHDIYQDYTVSRSEFAALPAELGNEMIIHWLRELKVLDFDRPTVNRLNVALRTSRAGTLHPVKDDLKIKISQKTAQFIHSL
jgi:tRNA(Ile)-lysidine synthetase-like protein